MQVRVSSGIVGTLQATARLVVALVPVGRHHAVASAPSGLDAALRTHAGCLPPAAPAPVHGTVVPHRKPVVGGGEQARLAEAIIDGMVLPAPVDRTGSRLTAMVARAIESMIGAAIPDDASTPMAHRGAEEPTPAQARRNDLPVLPLQPAPPPPPAPTLTLDPSLGTIVWNDDAPGDVPGSGGAASGGATDDADAGNGGFPTSWVAITGSMVGFVRGRGTSVAEFVGALARRRGLSRAQLLLLALAAPLATVFLIDAVARAVGGG